MLRFLTLPLTLLTLGLFLLVMNAFLLKLASLFTPGFKIRGFLDAVLGSLVLTILGYLLRHMSSRPALDYPMNVVAPSNPAELAEALRRAAAHLSAPSRSPATPASA